MVGGVVALSSAAAACAPMSEVPCRVDVTLKVELGGNKTSISSGKRPQGSGKAEMIGGG